MRPIFGLLVVLILATALGELYRYAREYWSEPWLAALIVNSGFAFVAVLLRRAPIAHERLQWLDLTPAAAIVVGTLALGILSRITIPGAQSLPIKAGEIWPFVVAVPVVEEWLFRVGFGSWLRSTIGGWLGFYLAALLFGLVHSDSSLSGWAHGAVGIPLGPFLLGFLCQCLFSHSGSVTQVILVHAACNATPSLFAITDARWLTWLRFLYL